MIVAGIFKNNILNSLVMPLLFITMLTTTSVNAEQCNSLYEVTTTKLNVRDKPGTSSNILSTVKKGDKICVNNFKDNWAHTQNGWISRNHLKKNHNVEADTAKIKWYEYVFWAYFVIVDIGLIIVVFINAEGGETDGRFKSGNKPMDYTIGLIYAVFLSIILYVPIWVLSYAFSLTWGGYFPNEFFKGAFVAVISGYGIIIGAVFWVFSKIF